MFLWQLLPAAEDDVEGEETQDIASEGAYSSAADVCVEAQETTASAKKRKKKQNEDDTCLSTVSTYFQ